MVAIKKVVLASLVSSAMLCNASEARADLCRDKQGVKQSTEIIMLLERDVPEAEIDVHVNSNIIQLAGFVDNMDQYRNVGAVIAKYKGAYRIINNVKVLVAKGNYGDDSRLRNDIEDRLAESKYCVENVDVQVRNGNVILSGFVAGKVPLSAIKKLSTTAPGVLTVDNYVMHKQV